MRQKYKPAELLLLLIGALFLSLRPFVSAVSIGTNDIYSWHDFARYIQQVGLIPLYSHDPLFNHPPLAGYLSAFLLWLSDNSAACFPFVFRLPGIFADCLSALMLFHAHQLQRSGKEVSAFFVASASLINILICSYHGNTDPIYAALALAAFLVAMRGKSSFLPGLLLGAACNIKIIPLILLPALLLSLPDRYAQQKSLLGFALAIIPFIVVGSLAGAPFWENIFLYSGFSGYWGALLFLRLSIGNLPEYALLIEQLIHYYGFFAKLVILILIPCVCMRGSKIKEFSPARLAALSATIFAVFAPGFAGQYFCMLTLLIIACSPKDGFWISLWSGLLMLCSYSEFLVTSFPFFSNHSATGGKLTLIVGFVAWLSIVVYFLKEMKALLSARPSGPNPG